MKVFYALLLFPLLAFAVPENKTYPNSGTNDAQLNQQTDVTEPLAVTPPAPQEMQTRPVEDPEAIQTGPYDKDGNYIYVQKKP